MRKTGKKPKKLESKQIKAIGSSGKPEEVERLFREAGQWIRDQHGQYELDFDDEKRLYSAFISGIRQVSVVRTELLLGKLFDEIGFNQITDELFRRLVLARLCFPVSKLKTADYLQKYHGVSVGRQ